MSLWLLQFKAMDMNSFCSYPQNSTQPHKIQNCLYLELSIQELVLFSRNNFETAFETFLA
jgi:hypothetical protein